MNNKLYTFVVNGKDEVFVGCDTGVFRSRDYGDKWVLHNQGLSNPLVHSLVLTKSGEMFAGTGGGVFRSTDGGETWTR